ncbi:type I secretion system permease/ATPase [Roseovarius mucosus]|uniref:type I secretion system permease/ATPase n=1 Tax=Roseovarius mucosus TaxID=215743 RepID=UPI001C5D8FAC|nr:type I secretion system permease/ATPase [Roseovarius mucosus]MBW4975575.1 type I secretion system permease/ATPase [Roseovarius mucosus]
MAQPRSQSDIRKTLKAKHMIGRDLKAYGLWIFMISGVINILALTGSVYMMQVYDRALTSGSIETLAFLSVLAIGLFFFHGAFDALRSKIMVRLGARMDRRLAPLTHKLAIEMPRYGFSTTEALERGRQVDTLRNFLASPAPAAMFDLPWMPIFLIFVFLLHPVLGSVALGGAVVLTLLTVIAELRSRNLAQAAQRSMIARNTAAESNARNADAMIAMGIVERAVGRFNRLNDDHLAIQARNSEILSTISAFSRVLRMILQSALLGLGAYFTIQGQLSAGAIIAVSVASARALAPIDQVIGNWRGIAGARHAYVQLRDTLSALGEEEKQLMDFPRATGNVTIEGLTVASPATGRILLADVSLELKAGQALAIVGPSGGGKSTLLRALSGVWQPLRGNVRFDGVSLSQIAPHKRGDLIGYLPQEVSLFDGSILENINRFSEDRNTTAVYEAATTSGVHRMIVDMPDGYDTQVGSHGTALSAGQRQRIGLARALYGNPFVVILDEPNASLDAAGEKALNDTIKAIRDRNGIVIVVAHRPNVLTAVDMLAVVQNGKLVAFGTKEEVLGNNSGRVVPPTDLVGDVRAQAAVDLAKHKASKTGAVPA